MNNVHLQIGGASLSVAPGKRAIFGDHLSLVLC
jgi:hypothetical protein